MEPTGGQDRDHRDPYDVLGVCTALPSGTLCVPTIAPCSARTLTPGRATRWPRPGSGT